MLILMSFILFRVFTVYTSGGINFPIDFGWYQTKAYRQRACTMVSVQQTRSLISIYEMGLKDCGRGCFADAVYGNTVRKPFSEDQAVLQGHRIDLCIIKLNYRQLVIVETLHLKSVHFLREIDIYIYINMTYRGVEICFAR